MTNQEAINFLFQVKSILLNSNSWLESTNTPITESFDMAISALQAQTEIVQCKNCKYWRQQTNYQGNPLSFGFCENDDIRTYTDGNHYCGYAERKIDEDN